MMKVAEALEAFGLGNFPERNRQWAEKQYYSEISPFGKMGDYSALVPRGQAVRRANT